MDTNVLAKPTLQDGLAGLGARYVLSFWHEHVLRSGMGRGYGLTTKVQSNAAGCAPMGTYGQAGGV